uniref:Hydroxysteroid dehydrogenase-like protein 1 n=1 Tax=Cacopsylla melanoneura TaxID=428564 RepID=A0A8D8XAI5_9HEMI
MGTFKNVYNNFYWHVEHEDYSLMFIIKLLGLFYVLKFIWWLVSSFLQSIVCKLVSFVYKPNLRKYGTWAVVTGSTDGIGKAYAIELAKRNMDIVLISRNVDKLNRTADEIRKIAPVQIKVIEADFTQGLQVYNHIEKELADLDIGILVNNVGIAPVHPTFRKLEDTSKEQLYNEVLVNNGAPSQMTRIVLPQMKHKKRGMIVFVGSIISVFECPYFTNYSGTKAFISQFANCIHREINHHNIHTQYLLPSITDTNLSKGNHVMTKLGASIRTFAYPSASTYACWAIDTLGWCRIAPGYWFFDFTYVFAILAENLMIFRFLGRPVLQLCYGRKVIN